MSHLRDLTEKLDDDLMLMTSSHNELQQQHRSYNLQKNLEREEFEKPLHSANQHTAVVHHEEEDNSFSHDFRQNLPNHNGDNGNFRTGHQQANSIELPGHGHARSAMLKVSRHVSEIMPLSYEDDEEALRGSEIPETQEEEKFSMTRSRFKDIMGKSLEDQKNLADTTSAEAIKAAFTKGVKHGSEMQTQPLHSSPMETETVHQNPIVPSDEYGLNALHQLRLVTSIAMAPSVVNKAIPVQQAANMPVVSINNGVIDGSKTLEKISSFKPLSSSLMAL